MRTRTSNRSKSYTAQKYDFDSSSGGEGNDDAQAGPAPRSRRGRRAVSDDQDENFDASALNESENDDVDEQDDGEPEVDSDAGATSDVETATATPAPRRPQQTRVRKAKPKTSASSGVTAPSTTAYIDVEPVSTDTHLKGYVGPFDRGMRGQTLINIWYGPRLNEVRLAQRILDRWITWTVLPPKYVPQEPGLRNKGPWAGDFFDKEASFADRWLAKLKSEFTRPLTRYSTLSASDALPYQLPAGMIPVIMGPNKAQKELQFTPGDAKCLSQSWIPFDADDTGTKIPTGWVFDVGGIVTGMDWMPHREGTDTSQILALAVIPHSDQEEYDYETEHQQPDFQKHGVVQLWSFIGEEVGEGIQRPSTHVPKLERTLCFEYGRCRRVKWSPACNHLAVLCGDGRVCVIEVDDVHGDQSFEKVDDPLASFVFNNEEGIKATSMAWATFNRLVVGYSDGSIALWSIYPNCLLSRYPVHHSMVVDIATAYPTSPYLVASTPLGGNSKLVDLCCPSYETTEVQTNAVSWQPNMLAYSDHARGFFSVYPSANALNTTVGFMHHRYFPIVRRIFFGDCFNSCLAVGRTHPFLLVGTTDGSLWALNPQAELFNSRREQTDRLRLFQHEHRPKQLFSQDSPASVCGASMIVHGFAMEKSRNPKAEIKAQGKKTKKPKKNDADAADGNDDDEGGGVMDPTRGIIHDPLTRIIIAEWNPNEGYGCWAAAAMASGLVRVIDLGVDNVPG